MKQFELPVLSRFLRLFLWLFLLVGCGSVDEAPVAPTLSIPTNTAIPPTLPAPTVAPATAVPSFTPQTTNLPTLQPTDTPEPLPTPTIEGLLGGAQGFPDNINPLTGLVSDADTLNQRPLAIKISNAPAVVRPQAGLNKADLIFEHYAEGGLTRFTAVFYGQEADPVGSIRSGRFIDLEIPKMYDAAFGYSGSSGPLREMFRDSDFFERIVSPDFAHGGYFRVEDPNKAVEHTLFTSTYNLRYILDLREQNRAPQLQNFMTFRDTPITAGEPATQLSLAYDGMFALWQYNASTNRYYRWTDGIAHVDANTNQQLNFQNVVVVYAHHQETDILEDFVGGGNYSIQIQIWGEGPVTIFRDGQMFNGRWQRHDPNHMLTFYDDNGAPLPLSPGNSFIQVVPLEFEQLSVEE